jgi:outer membrane protein TolC
VERYYGYRLSLKAVQLYSEVYDAMLLHQTNAIKLEENGMISKAQRLYVDLSVSMAQADLQNAINQANTVKDALKNTLADSTEINVTSELFLVKKIESLQYFQQAAIENNFLLKQVSAKKELAKQNFNLQKGSYFPSVAFVGRKEIANYQLTELMPEWFLGVNLRWTIFDGISRTYKVQSAKSTIDRVGFIETKAQADISTYVTKLYNELMSKVEEMETLETTYKFATEYLRVQQNAFAEGFATSKDLVDAQTTLNKVKTGRLKVMNDYVVKLAKLLEITGKPEMFLQYSQQPGIEHENFE